MRRTGVIRHLSLLWSCLAIGCADGTVWLWDSETDTLEKVRSFSYQDFRDRLS